MVLSPQLASRVQSPSGPPEVKSTPQKTWLIVLNPFDQTHKKKTASSGTHAEALGQVWFAPSNPPLTQAEFVKLMEAELGRPVKNQVGGPLLMRFLGLFNKEIAETVEMMYEWINPCSLQPRTVILTILTNILYNML